MTCPVGIDIRMIKNTGIGTYLRGLLSGLSDIGCLSGRNFSLFGPESPEIYRELRHYAFGSRIYTVSEQVQYLRHLGRCRVWHAPHYNVPVVRGKTKLVVTIHDIIHWIYRKGVLNPVQTFYARTMLSRAARYSDHIIAVSARTRDDLVEHFHADPSRITVIHEGVDPAVRRTSDAEIEAVKAKYGIRGSYFIYVGLLKPHKNVVWLIQRFKGLAESGAIRSKLVVIGRKDKRYPKGYEAYSDISTDQTVVYIPTVSFDDLRALYSGARSLLHPSFYEGFGLTLLEAMACETPVAAFRTGSIPEIAGDAAWLIEPNSEKEFRDAVVGLETQPRLREEWVSKGRERVRQFSWQQTARETVTVYEKVLGKKLSGGG